MTSEGQVWFIPYMHTQLGRGLIHKALEKGYFVATNRVKAADAYELGTFELSYPETIFPLQMDPSDRGSCMGAAAMVLEKWGRIDVAVHCTSQVYCGAVEEMDDWQISGQVQNTFINCTNILETMVPIFKRQENGHFIAITDINASSGGPGVGVLSGAHQAVESYSEGVALSLLSYNVKVTIVQADAEVTLLTNPVTFTNPMEKYEGSYAGRTRRLVANSNKFPTKTFNNVLTAITSIAGIKDPPSRLFVGENVIDQVRNKLTTFSEELDGYQSS